jgi:hypothetical protein
MRWEYKFVEIEVSGFRPKKKAEKAAAELNKWGAEGWEAVSVWSDGSLSIVLLKRGVPK